MTIYVGIELDPNNKTLWAALKACEAAFAADKKHRFAAAEVRYIHTVHRGAMLQCVHLLFKNHINVIQYIHTYIHKYRDIPCNIYLLHTVYAYIHTNNVYGPTIH